MPNSKEIRSRINSVKSTKKITRAMEMISASKLKKARDRMEVGRPYAAEIRRVIGHLANANPEYQHVYLRDRSIKRVGYVVVASDRALCGGLNINLFKRLAKEILAHHENGVEVDLALIGQKAELFFKKISANIVSYAHHLGDQPKIKDLIGSVKVMIDAFDEGKIDRIYLASNVFESTISQKPTVAQLLPVVPADLDEGMDHHWDYIYEPDAKAVMTTLLVRYVESQVYQGVVENIACEQAARMMAMKNATDNAEEVINDLNLQYNKARQAAITQELAEIVSGSQAV